MDGEQYCSDLQGWAPFVCEKETPIANVPTSLEKTFTLEDIKADSAQFVNVRMIDFSHKAHFGRCHGIVLRKKKLQLKGASLKWRLHEGEGGSTHSRGS